jgi:hypothetical protein
LTHNGVTGHCTGGGMHVTLNLRQMRHNCTYRQQKKSFEKTVKIDKFYIYQNKKSNLLKKMVRVDLLYEISRLILLNQYHF